MSSGRFLGHFSDFCSIESHETAFSALQLWYECKIKKFNFGKGLSIFDISWKISVNIGKLFFRIHLYLVSTQNVLIVWQFNLKKSHFSQILNFLSRKLPNFLVQKCIKLKFSQYPEKFSKIGWLPFQMPFIFRSRYFL